MNVGTNRQLSSASTGYDDHQEAAKPIHAIQVAFPLLDPREDHDNKVAQDLQLGTNQSL